MFVTEKLSQRLKFFGHARVIVGVSSSILVFNFHGISPAILVWLNLIDILKNFLDTLLNMIFGFGLAWITAFMNASNL